MTPKQKLVAIADELWDLAARRMVEGMTLTERSALVRQLSRVLSDEAAATMAEKFTELPLDRCDIELELTTNAKGGSA